MEIREKIERELKKIVKDLGAEIDISLQIPKDPKHGDYTTNATMAAFANSKFEIRNSKFKSPMDLAKQIVDQLKIESVEKIEVVSPGFINFWVSNEYLLKTLQSASQIKKQPLSKQKIMVEYAHPNTHKEMHIGHMRTLITGEAISRLLKATGAEVFRANYQGDIGPHVAKALYGVEKLLKERSLSLDEVEKWSHKDKAHFLGEAYVAGNRNYEDCKAAREEIDTINQKLYQGSKDFLSVYEKTRKWSLDYYEDFYTRFYTKFNRLFFESEMADCGKNIVLENLKKVFIKDEGAIIFPGEKYGLHRRVFITSDGHPTYEGKETCNAHKQFNAFAFDKKIHVVANEQSGYFKVVFKALELIDPKKFKDKQFHISMGMVQLKDPSAGSGQARKMSSRTGDVLTVDWLIDQVREKVFKLLKSGRIEAENKVSPHAEHSEAAREEIAEQITIGAIKYSVLKVGTGQNVAFDIEKSVSLDGDSGPYLQYTYARTQSVLAKASHQPLAISHQPLAISHQPLAISHQNSKLEPEEEDLLRFMSRFQDVVGEAAQKLAPNVLCTYLFELAQRFNLFYQKHKIIGSDKEDLRLSLTSATGQVLQKGLDILGIKSPKKM